MRTVQVIRLDGPEVLKPVDAPEPGAGKTLLTP
jgi:hypothetical protein